jgi:Tfp pilus assembly protein PilN
LKLFTNKTSAKSEINLLPEKYRYDIFKGVILKVSVLIFIFNIILISMIYVDKVFELKDLKKTHLFKKGENNKILALNDKLLKYQNEKQSLIKELNALKSIENEIKEVKYKSNSALYDIISLLELLTGKNEIVNMSYAGGVFRIEGVSDSPKEFYRFYSILDKSKSIVSADFQSLEKKDGRLSFSLIVKMKGIDG